MGSVNKESHAYRASVILRRFARDMHDQRLANVIRMIDSRLRFFIDGEGGSMEGEISHVSWAWSVETELRDLAYLGVVPDWLCGEVSDLLQQAVDHSLEVYRKKHEQIHL